MQTIADIAGDNAVHQIALSQQARWIQFTVTGTGTVRVGDSNVGASRGIPVAGGSSWTSPTLERFARYQVNEFYAYVPSGATLSVAYKEG